MITTTTTSSDENSNAVSIGSGMMKRQSPQWHGIANYIGVPSIEEHLTKVEKLGDKVVFPKIAVSGMGYFATYMDTENNTFSLWKLTECKVSNAIVANEWSTY